MWNLILEKGDSQNKACSICERPYTHTVMQSSTGKIIETDEPACDCEEKERQRKEYEKMKKSRQEKIIKIFSNPLMGQYVHETNFEKLESTKPLELCKDYAQQFLPGKSNGLQLVGNVGAGKTTLLAAMCNYLMQKNYTCLLITFSALLDIFAKHSFENAGNISDLLNWLTKIDFISFDDYGRENYTGKRIELAFRIIDTLMINKTTIAISANQDRLNKLREIPGMDATLDRLRAMCPILIEFNGDSLRGKT